jgi:hypothetical protein
MMCLQTKFEQDLCRRHSYTGKLRASVSQPYAYDIEETIQL